MPTLTKSGHVAVSCLDEQNVHVFTRTPYSPDYGLGSFWMLFSPVDKAETGGF